MTFPSGLHLIPRLPSGQFAPTSLVTLLDTSVANANLGNQIIMQSIEKELSALFPHDFFIKLQYGERFGSVSLDYLQRSRFSFFGGTNSLSSEMNRYSQMGFRLRDTLKFGSLVLMGLGWWQYQSSPNQYTKIFLRRLLCSSVLHSVRDRYTLAMLANIGITNVLNTSCPTTWSLTPDHCSRIPTRKARSVVTTVTDYNANQRADLEMINLLAENYSKVYIWLQGLEDYKYLEGLGVLSNSKLELVSPSLQAYEKVLNDVETDYVGTRLHAGIKAIQFCKRALIVSVDNRASEIARDINLNVCERGNLLRIQNFILDEYVTAISIPLDNIFLWREQFSR